MTLEAGTKLGPYEVLAPIGAGGMGEVYKAKDTRLGRDVAVKVLPAHMSANAELRQRLDREAKTISALSHAHICALYDVGHQDATDYLVPWRRNPWQAPRGRAGCSGRRTAGISASSRTGSSRRSTSQAGPRPRSVTRPVDRTAVGAPRA